MRYTSFGRHFTKIDKLKEIADILHWYVQDGDMLVDFCCGSNDFSCLMKKKLDEMGRMCSFKNYDILQAKNDFNFERRDWMGVKKEELPDGSKLIMGLNPPFGVNAALANKFINKALEFKPKLLILIVPRETLRLDEKEPPYDLIWEDDQMLAGKSFYLPGSVDVNDKQIEDWNASAPVLYLWSRPAWTPKHRAIAEKHSHKSGALKRYRLDKSRDELQASNSAQAFNDKASERGEDKHADTPTNLKQKGNEIISHQEALPCSINSTPKTQEQTETISLRDGLPRDINSTEVGKGHAAAVNHSEPTSKSFGGKGNKKRPPSNMFQQDMPSSKVSVLRHQSPDMTNHLVTYPAEHRETPSQFHSESGDYWQRREVTEHRETPSQFHSERVDYRLSREVSQVNSERDGYQQLSRSRELSQVLPERSGYQQFSQTNFSTHQSYTQTENNGDGVSDLLEKYFSEDHQHGVRDVHEYDAHHSHCGMSGGQAYAMSPNHDYAQRPHGGHAYDVSDYHAYASPAATSLLMNEGYHAHSHGRMEAALPHQGTAGYSHQYGLGSIAAPSSGYMERITPAAQRYAARLDEPHHARMGPMVSGESRLLPPPPPNQGALGFARGPYNPPPHQNSTGWIHD